MKEASALCGLPSFFASQLPGKIDMRGSGGSQVPEETPSMVFLQNAWSKVTSSLPVSAHSRSI
jgi:hypothetical protein